ncbi:MAG: hypothetical protein AB7S26_09900 [Sandaracinaceae bacterium]
MESANNAPAPPAATKPKSPEEVLTAATAALERVASVLERVDARLTADAAKPKVEMAPMPFTPAPYELHERPGPHGAPVFSSPHTDGRTAPALSGRYLHK